MHKVAAIQLEKIECRYDGKIVLSGENVTAGDGELVLVCGRTGSGKSTLLKYLFDNLGTKAGFVMQNPDSQLVCDKVYEELGLAPSGAGMDDALTGRRIAETAGYFGISGLMDRDTDTLSGGEKQLVNIAAVMTVNPGVLLLDEPTAMLDPIMAERVIGNILKLRRELGITVVIAEHRPDMLWQEADSILLVDNGKIIQEKPDKMAEIMTGDSRLYELMPSYARMLPFDIAGQAVMSLAQAKKIAAGTIIKLPAVSKKTEESRPFLEFRNVTFAYEKNGRKILDDMNFKVGKGQIAALLGENGSGKTTAAKVASGLLKPYSGAVYVDGQKLGGSCTCAGMLFQDTTCHFLDDECTGRFAGKHPYDLSGGERQLAALDIVLSKSPKLLILDEPTKGLDRYEKEVLRERIIGLSRDGVTVLMITHDVDFAAETADIMALLFEGVVSASGDTEKFVRESLFYTTSALRVWGAESGIYTEKQARELTAGTKQAGT